MSRISFASVAAMPRHASSRTEDTVGRAAGMRECRFHRHRAGDGDYGALLSLSAKSERAAATDPSRLSPGQAAQAHAAKKEAKTQAQTGAGRPQASNGRHGRH
ncbi:uncharacterized protein CCOS01_12541 [Colletotrichum costaricense]|uniref:Uncharacterized protein n=1 Tax=Colletotrichum costaricense TaxID=1209916 RepID=A0AAI9YN11_9PEZI|nr:uncharacterized protein CCOS01_12541 [Colletotrichum costaricense]KAK1516992.1 hypothetical protein CCOS01_12541 [Colletotrichum costaricense]